ncbi:MAG: hypothetical protein AAB511_01300 [Patescibacteria group bacterium]
MEATNFLNVAFFFQKISDLFSGGFSFVGDSSVPFILGFLSFIRPLSVAISLLFLTGIIYSVIRMNMVISEVMKAAHHHPEGDDHGEAHGGSHGVEPAHASNSRWDKIMSHINSPNESDWRLAILECDIVLDEMLTKMSYRGETLADKLKAVEKSDFLTIDKAWEAHRVRNSIAHAGSNFKITDREAKRVVGLYEEVFKEFHYI